MKIDCEVIGVEAGGDCMEITLQGTPPRAADWRPLYRQVVKIPQTKAAAKAFHIGRRCMIRIETR